MDETPVGRLPLNLPLTLLSEEEVMFQAAAREFAVKEIGPHVEEMDREGAFKRELLEKFPLPGLASAIEPAFSPDGRAIAFSGMKEGLTDIYLYRLDDHTLRPLTSDPQDDQSPAFSPDGRNVIYSSEVEAPGDAMPYQRRLYSVDLTNL